MLRTRLRVRADARQAKHEEAGASAVEFALVLPILLVLVFGLINFGIILNQKASLNSAVRSGARYGSVNIIDSATDPHTCGKLVTRARQSAATMGMPSDEIDITIKRGADEASAVPIPGCPTSDEASIVRPCVDAVDPSNPNYETLFVEATFDSQLLIPVPAFEFNDFNLFSQGAYRCEYR